MVTGCIVLFMLISFDPENNDAASSTTGDKSNDNVSKAIGSTISFLSALFAIVAFLVREGYLKDAKKTPYYIQQVHLNVSTFFFHIILLFVVLPLFGQLLDTIVVNGLGKDSKNVAKKVNLFTYKANFQTVSDINRKYLVTTRKSVGVAGAAGGGGLSGHAVVQGGG